MTPPPPIPLTLVTGPLGSGKTQFINAALADETFGQPLVLANETGATPSSRPSPEIAGMSQLDQQACLCCGGRGRFAGLLETLLRGRDNRRMDAFDRLIVETAGEADPAPMLAELIGHPYLGRRFAIHGVIAVVPRVSPSDDTALHRQLACADAALFPIDVDPRWLASLKGHLPDPGSAMPLPLSEADAAALLSQPRFARHGMPDAVRRRLYAAGLRGGAR